MKRSQDEEEEKSAMFPNNDDVEDLPMVALVECYKQYEDGERALRMRLNELLKNGSPIRAELMKRAGAYIMENLRAFSITNERFIDGIGPIVDFKGPVYTVREASLLTCDGHAWITTSNEDSYVEVTWFNTRAASCVEASARQYRDDTAWRHAFNTTTRVWTREGAPSDTTTKQFEDTLALIQQNPAIVRMLNTELQYMYRNFTDNPVLTYHTIEQLKANRERNKEAKVDEEEEK